MNLFTDGEFTSHSGLTLPFKIDCDALTDADLDTLAKLVGTRPWMHFSEVHGVPSGGLRFAKALKKYALTTPNPLAKRILLVDDVLSTGAAITELRNEWEEFSHHRIRGLVIFARGPCPGWVTPLFTMDRDLR